MLLLSVAMVNRSIGDAAFYGRGARASLRVNLLRVDWTKIKSYVLELETESKWTQNFGLDSEFIEPPFWDGLLIVSGLKICIYYS